MGREHEHVAVTIEVGHRHLGRCRQALCIHASRHRNGGVGDDPYFDRALDLR